MKKYEKFLGRNIEEIRCDILLSQILEYSIKQDIEPRSNTVKPHIINQW